MTLIKKITIVVRRGGRIDRCFYPVFPSDIDAGRILEYLRERAV